MSGSILSTALSGLTAFQRSLETTSHNINNVNTEGYSRQRTELATRPAQYTGSGYVGTGVDVNNIARSYDQFVDSQLRSSTSSFGEMDKYYTLASRIDEIVADEETGMSSVLKSFFDAVNDVADDPSSIPARQVMLSEAEFVANRFNEVSTQFSAIRSQINKELDLMVSDVNNIASALADLNVEIVEQLGRTSGQQQPNDLFDQRDLLLSQLSEKIDVSTVSQADGSINVFIGKGQPLVLSASSTTLTVASSAVDSSKKEIHLGGQDISSQLTGGEIVGTLRFRDEVLDPAQQRLGLTAAGLAVEINTLHNSGFDLNGVAGGDLFSLGTPEIPVVNMVSAAGGSVTATYKASAANLDTSDYRLDVTGTGPTTFTLTRLSDNTVIPAANVGFDVAFTGTMTAGDQFFIRPTYQAAQSITTLISDPNEIAASQTATTIPGDNRIALQLAALETQAPLLGGTTSLVASYGQLVADVGAKTHSANINRSAQEALLSQAQQSREAVSGVNLDEEAANLIKYQNSYQAAAQVVSVANSLFDTLIGAFR